MDEFKLESLAKEKEVLVPAGDFESGFEKVFAPYVKPDGNEPVVETVEKIKEEVEQPLITEQDVANSRAKGYEEGYAKGYAAAKSASEELDKSINATILAVGSKLDQILQAKQFDELKSVEDVVNVVLNIAQKVAGTTLAENANEQVEQAVKKSFQFLFDEPKVVIYVNSQAAQSLNERIDALIKSEGFNGEIVIKENNKLSAGSCEIQWEGGGLKSDKDSMWEIINSLC